MHREQDVAVRGIGPIGLCGAEFHLVANLAEGCHCDEHFVVVATRADDVFSERVRFVERGFEVLDCAGRIFEFGGKIDCDCLFFVRVYTERMLSLADFATSPLYLMTAGIISIVAISNIVIASMLRSLQ